jgi:hypothetical protein
MGRPMDQTHTDKGAITNPPRPRCGRNACQLIEIWSRIAVIRARSRSALVLYVLGNFGPHYDPLVKPWTDEQQMEYLRKLIAKTTDQRFLRIYRAKLKEYELRKRVQ